MIVTFAYPSTARFGGGVKALYEYTDALARRGHEVHFAHLQILEDAIDDPAEIRWHRFHPSVVHHLVADLDDPTLPEGDVMVRHDAPRRLGQPVEIVQGYRLLASALERPNFRASCPKITVAGWLAEVGVAWGSHREQFWHVPPGIDTDVFTLRTPLAGRPVDVAMLFTDHPVKGAADGLAALEHVRRQRPDLRVALFGWLPPSAAVPTWAELHVGLGHHRLADEVFGQAKVFVQPSWREGFGLTPVEAMACGAALVTTDNGGSRDYAHPGRTALVVPPRDVDALATAITTALGDDDLRGRLAMAGSELAATFTWDAAGERLERHLEGYLADPAALQRPPTDAPMFLEDSW